MSFSLTYGLKRRFLRLFLLARVAAKEIFCAQKRTRPEKRVLVLRPSSFVLDGTDATRRDETRRPYERDARDTRKRARRRWAYFCPSFPPDRARAVLPRPSTSRVDHSRPSSTRKATRRRSIFGSLFASHKGDFPNHFYTSDRLWWITIHRTHRRSRRMPIEISRSSSRRLCDGE